VKDLTGSGGSAAVEREARKQAHWGREVLRRGLFELLYLIANLAIAAAGLLWLYRLFMHKPALKIGLVLAAAVASSLLGYHLARWRASAAVWRQVEKLMASLIAMLGIGGAKCAIAWRCRQRRIPNSKPENGETSTLSCATMSPVKTTGAA
jgi:hypothetical protein